MEQEALASKVADARPPDVRLRLLRLRIEKYRNVVPRTVLVFNDGMNVLLGPNGSGKTTLLRLVAAVVRDEFGALAEEEIDILYDVQLFDVVFRIRLAQRRMNGGAHARRPAGPHGPGMEWWLVVSAVEANGKEMKLLEGSPLGMKDLLGDAQYPVQDPFRETGPVSQVLDVLLELADRVSSREGAIEQQDASSWGAFSSFLEKANRLRLSLLSQGGRFDEGLGVFAGIVGSPAVLEMPDRRFANLWIRDDEVDGSFLPEELRQAVATQPRETRGVNISLTDADLPFLKRAVELFGGQRAEMILRRQQEEDGTVTYNDFEFHITLDDGTTVRHELLSWGQKRILAFLYYAAANPDILVIDELVNGLHHEWISACFEVMEGRQCFLTSQNPLLLDHLAFESADDVRRTFILCRRERGERKAEQRWGAMDEVSAESFFRAYKVGIQHVGELLRTKGLW